MPVYRWIDGSSAARVPARLQLQIDVGAGFSVGKKYVGAAYSRPESRIVVAIFSTRHIHPDAVTYFCDDARSYKAVEDSACGIRGDLE